METYNRLPVGFARGEGAYLEDTEGRRYLDALTGLAVCGLGHAHPNVTRAISEQAATLSHTSNLYEVPIQASLAQRLCTLSGMDRVFFESCGVFGAARCGKAQTTGSGPVVFHRFVPHAR